MDFFVFIKIPKLWFTVLQKQPKKDLGVRGHAGLALKVEFEATSFPFQHPQ